MEKFIIDGGAPLSGEIVAAGMPEDVAKAARSYTGQYLKPLLKARAPERLGRSALRAAE